MQQKASKIKIRVRRGKWFVFLLPPLSFKFLRWVCRLGLKFSAGEWEHSQYDSPKTQKSLPNRNSREIRLINSWQVDRKELLIDLDYFLEELAKLEPFVLAEVKEETEKLYVKIETV